MIKSVFNFLINSSFKNLLATTYVAGILLLIVIATIITSNLSTQSVEESLRKTGIQLVESFANRSRLALLYQSEDEAQIITSSILSFPDVTGAGIYDEKMQPIYLSHNKLAQISQKLSENAPVLDYENDLEWVYSSAVFSTTEAEISPFSDVEFEPQLLGYVRLNVGKSALTHLKTDFFKYNLIVIGALASLLLWALLTITGRVTKPIQTLAKNMHKAAIGGTKIRTYVGGTQDIIDMELAFNNLMKILEKREAELLTTRDLALEAAKIKGEFAANVSHELRTPLNGISGMLELLSEMSLTVQQKDYLEVASSSADSLLELIDDVLDFSVYDQKDITLNKKSFNLSETLEDFIVLLSPQAQRKNLTIAYFIDDDVPKQLIADNVRLQQILHNLLGNALKFTRHGSVSVSVKKQKNDDGDNNNKLALLFEVSDTGIGIPPEAQEKVFQAFAQADSSTTREYGGTGLGLAICRQLVTLFGGEIGLSSHIGEGSTFWFTIKVETDDDANSPLSTTAKIKPLQNNMLYVGDNTLCRRFIDQRLKALSYSADYVNNGTAALNMMRQQAKKDTPYDIVIIDELSTGIRQHTLTKFINDDEELNSSRVILTINRHINEVEISQAQLNAEYLTKPVREADLSYLLNISLEIRDNKTPDSPGLEQASIATASFEHAHILVVEDNRANQLVAKAMLERFNCKITIACNGKEAVEIASHHTFDLIFMDCQMPEMDGYEATFQLRQMETQGLRTTIVAMTANKQNGDREKCLAVGMDDFMSKPLKLETLADLLNRWLGPDEENITLVNAEEASSSGDNGVLDESAFAYLSDNLGDEVITILSLFHEDMPGYLERLASGLKSNDLQQVSGAAHTIKGTAASIGALQLRDACQALEQACSDKKIDALTLLHETLLCEADRAMEAIALKMNPGESPNRNMSAINQDQSKILIVDDDRAARQTIKSTLEKQGYYVDEVTNGEQALMYCERIKPDLIVLDAVMRGIDGFETCKKITQQYGSTEIPIIILTALENEASINRAFQVGASDYLSKPINFPLFHLRIQRLLSVKHTEKQITYLAHKDALTGLMNRAMFTEKAAEVLEAHQLNENMMAIMFLDINRFKLVNDSYGHEAGDLLLKIVAERLTRSIRQEDIVSRFGGDEFVIALTNIKSFDIIEKLAQKIQTNISRPFVFLGREMHVAASIGISVSPSNGTNISDLIKNADMAMYQSKDSKSPYVFYERTMEDKINQRFSLENDLRNAIERDELKVFYQPQFSLATGDLVGMEALVRWQHPEKGLIPPDSFIGLSEETGQIHVLGKWVLSVACSRLKEWLDRGIKPVRMAVNLSAYQLEDQGIVDTVSKIVKEVQLPSHLLELEITESSVMNNEELVIEKLETFKTLGMKLAIDDFGTGYSSLSYLKRFPINLLKIDRSFVSNSLVDKVDADIIRTIIILAHSMGVEVIAEGVETVEQSELLESLHCDYVQGYLYGKPMPAEEFEAQFFPNLPDSNHLEMKIKRSI
ncbi:MAG: EAL domain-containing protein [Cycloclasticus sp.]